MNQTKRKDEGGGRAIVLAAVLLTVPVGCGKSDGQRHDVSGSITFDGAPVPAGKIYFSPDTSKNNDGPQGYADITSGHYDTRPTDTGSPGGPVHVRIEGFDGKPAGDFIYGQPLFFYETSIELPRQTTTKDFQVPASAAKSVAKPPTRGP